MEHSYLVRYGLMRRVGQFASGTGDHQRGQTVVLHTHRGTELGEVLLAGASTLRGAASAPATGSARLVRAASAEDLEHARRAELDRPRRFALCQQVFQDGVWPIELIDVESLLDERRTVLHYLGPHHLEIAGLRSVFRESCDLDIVLEPVGRDAAESPEESGHGCGNCGSGGGGCGSDSGGCSTTGGGCGDCAVKTLLASRRVPARH